MLKNRTNHLLLTNYLLSNLTPSKVQVSGLVMRLSHRGLGWGVGGEIERFCVMEENGGGAALLWGLWQ